MIEIHQPPSNPNSLRTGFAGSPEFAATILQRMVESRFKPQVVYTQPDKPKGRGRKLLGNAVKTAANESGLEVQQPGSLKDLETQTSLDNYQLDILVVAAYGMILPPAVLSLPKFGCINVHASLLPRWRGAAPIERAVMAGDDETGICIMQMEAGLDTGPVFKSLTCPINLEESSAVLESNLADLGADALLDVLGTIEQEQCLPGSVPQQDKYATYAHKLTANDRQLDWSRPAELVNRQIWALSNRLPARCKTQNVGVQILSAHVIQQNLRDSNAPVPGTIIDVSKKGIVVQCATNALRIDLLKLEKGKGTALTPAQAINGYAELLLPGQRFAEY